MSDPTERDDLHAEDGEEEDRNEAEIAWANELKRRIDDVREGRVRIVPGAEVSAMMHRILNGEEG